jgi:hypothetical protein
MSNTRDGHDSVNEQAGYDARAWRRATPEPEPSEVIDLKLPSGFVAQVTRPPIEMWILSGAVPMDLMDQAISTLRAQSPEEKEAGREEMAAVLRNDPQKLRRALTFMRDAVRHALVRPRLVVGADPSDPDQIDPKDIPMDDFVFLFNWVVQNSPGVKVTTESGKGTTVEAVGTFRQQSGVSGTRSHVRKTAGAHKRKARNKR